MIKVICLLLMIPNKSELYFFFFFSFFSFLFFFFLFAFFCLGLFLFRFVIYCINRNLYSAGLVSNMMFKKVMNCGALFQKKSKQNRWRMVDSWGYRFSRGYWGKNIWKFQGAFLWYLVEARGGGSRSKVVHHVFSLSIKKTKTNFYI